MAHISLNQHEAANVRLPGLDRREQGIHFLLHRFESMTNRPGWNRASWFSVVNPSPKEATTAIEGQAVNDARSDCCIIPGRDTTMVGTGGVSGRVVSIVSMGPAFRSTAE